MSPTRAMTPLAGDIGDHRLKVDLLVVVGGNLGRVTVKASQCIIGLQNFAM
jgi:hypothetical protein